MSKLPIKVFSFFSGSGLLDLGFELNGFDVAYVNEYFEPFLDAYKHSRKVMGIKEPEFGYSTNSIEDLLGSDNNGLSRAIKKSKDSGALIGFIGGPPCPDFSVGGKNRGNKGENGRLSQTYADLICKEEPDWFLFENVKGLWRTKKHRAFYEELKGQLSKKYVLTDRLTNSLEAGAPQDRDRILLFGLLKSRANSDEIELPFSDFLPFEGTAVFEHDWVTTTPFEEDKIIDKPNNIPVELTVEYWFKKNDVSNHPNSNKCFRPKAGLTKFKAIDEGDVSKKSFKRLHRWRYSPTVAYGNNEVHLHPYKPRRLSVAEALSLQSMPKEFELPDNMTLSNMFKTIGNGVPYLLSDAIAKTILSALSQNNLE